jgi:hypothetical protein
MITLGAAVGGCQCSAFDSRDAGDGHSAILTARNAGGRAASSGGGDPHSPSGRSGELANWQSGELAIWQTQGIDFNFIKIVLNYFEPKSF